MAASEHEPWEGIAWLVYLDISGTAANAQSAERRGTRAMIGISARVCAGSAGKPGRRSTTGAGACADVAGQRVMKGTISSGKRRAVNAKKPAPYAVSLEKQRSMTGSPHHRALAWSNAPAAGRRGRTIGSNRSKDAAKRSVQFAAKSVPWRISMNPSRASAKKNAASAARRENWNIPSNGKTAPKRARYADTAALHIGGIW